MTSEPKKKFIVVEDDSRMRENIVYFLNELGFETIAQFETADISGVLKHVDQANALLLDINLPGKINGVELALQIRDKSEIPIIYITGNVDNSIFEKAAQTNIYGYLPKPFNRAQFEYVLRVALLREMHEAEKVNQLRRIKEKEKLIQIGEFAGSFIHDVNNFNMLTMRCLERIFEISKENSDDERLTQIHTYSEKGHLGVKRINNLAVRYRRFFLNNHEKDFLKVDMKQLLEEVREFFKDSLYKEDISLTIECKEDMNFYSSDIIILQSLVNLISNSRQSILEKSLTEKWIKVEVKPFGASKVCIEVSDSGHGIPHEIAKNVFDEGFSTKKELDDQGAGMGLSFVKKNIEDILKGEINILEERENTTFEILLPLEMAC